HRLLLRPENPARNQLEHVAIFPDDDRVPRVVPARHPRNVVKRPGKIIDNLAFSFIAPLRPHHDNRFHSDLSPSTLPHIFHYFAKTSLESTKKRQAFIVSSHRPQRKQTVRSLPFRQISIPEATHQVIVHHSSRLHESVANR